MASERDTITFICTANVCRSPMAERLLADALKNEPEPLKNLKIKSAGVSALSGDRASNNSVEALDELGIDLSDHKSARLTPELIDSSIAIFCMTESHRALISMYYDNVDCDIYLMRELLPPPADIEIPDPFGSNLEIYRLCRESMQESIPSIVEFLRKKLNV